MDDGKWFIEPCMNFTKGQSRLECNLTIFAGTIAVSILSTWNQSQTEKINFAG